MSHGKHAYISAMQWILKLHAFFQPVPVHCSARVMHDQQGKEPMRACRRCLTTVKSNLRLARRRQPAASQLLPAYVAAGPVTSSSRRLLRCRVRRTSVLKTPRCALYTTVTCTCVPVHWLQACTINLRHGCSLRLARAALRRPWPSHRLHARYGTRVHSYGRQHCSHGQLVATVPW